jgi:hypothetical protein
LRGTRRLVDLVGTVALMLVASPSHATAILFDFNSLPDGAGNGSVQSYMRSLLPGVSVIGATSERNYNAEGHVVGPVTTVSRSASHGSGKGSRKQTVTSETLGTTDGSVPHAGPPDTFLINTAGANQITISFPAPIYGVSFDYEIFPDQTCATAGCPPGDWPDFTFVADGSVVFRTLGITPGASGTYAHSPASAPASPERSPQLLAVSGEWLFASGVTQLSFVDWPRTIGIDNLRIDPDAPTPPPVVTPEPSALVLLGASLSGMVAFRRFRPLRP